jgi:hypothetical protein
MVNEYVTTDYAKSVCKIGTGYACCRYLTMAPKGWSCEKGTALKETLDLKVAKGQMIARGDNCEGRRDRST